MRTPTSQSITSVERIDRIRLIRSENVGPVTFRQLLDRYGSASAAIAALPALAKPGGRGRTLKIGNRRDVEDEIIRNEAIGARLIVTGEPDYPSSLLPVEDAPPVISALGNIHLLARRAVALVGARNASANALRFTRTLTSGIGEVGYVVVSGLTRGIDASAHTATLDTGTIAVTAGGIDVIYPSENKNLYHQIVEQGVVVAESVVGTTPQARHFPSRNRIISGLSLGVLVIEAAHRSGSLITARFAADQGRKVFAVPGSPLDPRCKGTNALIRDGAHIVENARDMVEVLEGPSPPRVQETNLFDFREFTPVQPDPKELERAGDRVLELLGPAPVAVDEIIRECQFSPAVVVTVLLEAELAGAVERHPGNQVSRRFEAMA